MHNDVRDCLYEAYSTNPTGIPAEAFDELAHSWVNSRRARGLPAGVPRQSTDAVTATDFFEHLTKVEVLEALDRVYDSLRPSENVALRVPNAVNPFGGNW